MIVLHRTNMPSDQKAAKSIILKSSLVIFSATHRSSQMLHFLVPLDKPSPSNSLLPLKHRGHLVLRSESFRGRDDAIVQKLFGVRWSAKVEMLVWDVTWARTAWNYDPEHIEKDEITPVIIGLRSAIYQSSMIGIKQAGSVVENIAVELSERYDCLNGVTKRVGGQDEPGNHEG